jgi:hypothetical protein
MKINKLWSLPILSSEIEEGVNISNDGMDIVLSFKYALESDRQKKYEIRFESVLCHMHTSERFTPKMFDSYDTLVSLEESEWLDSLKILNSRDFEFWKPKHFVIYFDGSGQYQFIAREFIVSEKEVE